MKANDLVLFSGCQSTATILSISGKTAKVKSTLTGEVFNKRLSSLELYKPKEAYWNEQELAEEKHNHGDVVFSSLTNRDDTNGVYVWDENKKDIVRRENLS